MSEDARTVGNGVLTAERLAEVVDEVTGRVGAVHSLAGYEWVSIRNEIRRGVVATAFPPETPPRSGSE